jgi:hypothetical protein
MWDEMLSCGVKRYHVGYHVDELLSCGMKCFQFIVYVIMWTHGCHVGSMLSCGVKCYHAESNVIMWDQTLLCGINFIMWGQMLS